MAEFLEFCKDTRGIAVPECPDCIVAYVKLAEKYMAEVAKLRAEVTFLKGMRSDAEIALVNHWQGRFAARETECDKLHAELEALKEQASAKHDLRAELHRADLQVEECRKALKEIEDCPSIPMNRAQNLATKVLERLLPEKQQSGPPKIDACYCCRGGCQPGCRCRGKGSDVS